MPIKCHGDACLGYVSRVGSLDWEGRVEGFRMVRRSLGFGLLGVHGAGAVVETVVVPRDLAVASIAIDKLSASLNEGPTQWNLTVDD